MVWGMLKAWLGKLNAATLLFARQPLAYARGSDQSRDRQGADAQSFMTLCLEER
jgi:hypothetical protein